MALDQVQADLRAVVVEGVAEVVAPAGTSRTVAVRVAQGSGVRVVVPDVGNFLVEHQVRRVCRPHSVVPC